MVPVWKIQFLKRLNINLFYDLAIPFPHIYPKEITHIHKRMYNKLSDQLQQPEGETNPSINKENIFTQRNIIQMKSTTIDTGSKIIIFQKYTEQKTDRHRDFPGGPTAKTSGSQCGQPGFHPWSGNWSTCATAESLHAATKDLAYLN